MNRRNSKETAHKKILNSVYSQSVTPELRIPKIHFTKIVKLACNYNLLMKNIIIVTVYYKSSLLPAQTMTILAK